jgi:hypothetical protein
MNPSSRNIRLEQFEAAQQNLNILATDSPNTYRSDKPSIVLAEDHIDFFGESPTGWSPSKSDKKSHCKCENANLRTVDEFTENVINEIQQGRKRFPNKAKKKQMLTNRVLESNKTHKNSKLGEPNIPKGFETHKLSNITYQKSKITEKSPMNSEVLGLQSQPHLSPVSNGTSRKKKTGGYFSNRGIMTPFAKAQVTKHKSMIGNRNFLMEEIIKANKSGKYEIDAKALDGKKGSFMDLKFTQMIFRKSLMQEQMKEVKLAEKNSEVHEHDDRACKKPQTKAKDESPRSYARRMRDYNKKKLERQRHKKCSSQVSNDGA